VRQVEEIPDCFSRPICKLAMQLNDHASDVERQRLLPFVSRLACADTPDVEVKRAAFINSKEGPNHSFEYGLKVLEDALAIGRQADLLEIDDVRRRKHPAGGGAVACVKVTSLADSPVFAKVKSLFARKKQTEAA
jgi:hypothetical protein